MARTISIFSASLMREGAPDAMSLCYADTSLPDLLGRSSLHYADHVYAMLTVSQLCSERASTIQDSFSKSWFLCLMKNANRFF